MANFIVTVKKDNIKICWGGRFGVMSIEQAKKSILDLHRAISEIDNKKKEGEKNE